ncbi:hypothetical protein [Phenylobacterium sp. J367]|uniref:hypothetical protein n=1 Tax=Phenylobacterium sp. J367 TaxID=2898435 RepID=UPI002150A10D|nr:hypothetical protein [Phenylobacterium sp. J367]MCR5880812.1 hypothetical protein [Phenylobacterium sp. J367]
MPTYTYLIVDDRYSVPSLKFEEAENDGEAQAAARADLQANPHHAAVEVRQGDQMISMERRAHPRG